MDAIELFTSLSDFNWISVICGLILILSIVVTVTTLIGKFCEIIGKPLKWFKKTNHDHELLIKTSEALTTLQTQHHDDIKQLLDHDQLIKDDLSTFASEIKVSTDEIKKEINQFTENRLHDREQSFEIQKELTDSIKVITENGQKRDEQIDNLMLGTMELLGDKIDQRFSKYVSLGGIPENEVDEFVGIYNAYAATKGNHKRKDKFEYVMNHMSVIPVKTDLLKTAVSIDKTDNEENVTL